MELGRNSMLIYLTGFMCAGKTTAGKAAARILQIPFLDLDEELEQRSKLSVSEYIATHGLISFRRLESVFLQKSPQLLPTELLTSSKSTDRQTGIIATGGGCVLSPENRIYLNSTGYAVCWLNTPFELILDRLKAAPRPLLKDLTAEEIYRIYQQRLPYYQSTATQIITSAGQAEELVSLYGLT